MPACAPCETPFCVKYVDAEPETYAQRPAQAMFALALGRESLPSAVLSSGVKPISSKPQL